MVAIHSRLMCRWVGSCQVGCAGRRGVELSAHGPLQPAEPGSAACRECDPRSAEGALAGVRRRQASSAAGVRAGRLRHVVARCARTLVGLCRCAGGPP
eukprot:1182470-Prorocentrum_minimum.AAC.1